MRAPARTSSRKASTTASSTKSPSIKAETTSAAKSDSAVAEPLEATGVHLAFAIVVPAVAIIVDTVQAALVLGCARMDRRIGVVAVDAFAEAVAIAVDTARVRQYV